MKRSRFSEEQIIAILREQENGLANEAINVLKLLVVLYQLSIIQTVLNKCYYYSLLGCSKFG